MQNQYAQPSIKCSFRNINFARQSGCFIPLLNSFAVLN